MRISEIINGHLERGTFTNISVTKEELYAYYRSLKRKGTSTYIEMHKDGMVVLNGFKKGLSIYRIK